MTAFAPGNAVIFRGDWPGYITAVDGHHATVRFQQVPPDGLDLETVIATRELTRPHGWRILDRHPDGRAHGRQGHWSTPKLHDLRAAWALSPTDATAARFGTTRNGCKIVFGRWWGSVRQWRADRALSLRAVARILAVDEHRVMKLIRRRYLKAKPSGVAAGKFERWLITDEALGAFLQQYPEHYDWCRMPPGQWRTYAERIDVRDPLLTVAEVAARVYLDPKVVLRHIRSGRITAVMSSGGRVNSNRGWRVHASALVGFEVVASGDQWMRDARALLAARGMISTSVAARRLGIHRSTVGAWCRRGRLAAERVEIGRRVVWGVRPWTVAATRRAA